MLTVCYLKLQILTVTDCISQMLILVHLHSKVQFEVKFNSAIAADDSQSSPTGGTCGTLVALECGMRCGLRIMCCISGCGTLQTSSSGSNRKWHSCGWIAGHRKRFHCAHAAQMSSGWGVRSWLSVGRSTWSIDSDWKKKTFCFCVIFSSYLYSKKDLNVLFIKSEMNDRKETRVLTEYISLRRGTLFICFLPLWPREDFPLGKKGQKWGKGQTSQRNSSV